MGSALWFSQDLSGWITAFIAPYRSQSHKINEDNVIIKRYQEPRALTEKEISRLIKCFVRYCEATVYSGAYNRRLYLFRLWLQFKDVRNRQKLNPLPSR